MMAWFEKALKSVQNTAEKAAFEGDKLIQANREESVLSDLQKKAQARLVDLGQAALALYRRGTLADPAVAALAAELADLEGQVQQQKDKVEAIRHGQYQPEDPAAPAARAVPAVPAVSAASVAPEPLSAPALVECPSCHAEVMATVTFCPECGSRLK